MGSESYSPVLCGFPYESLSHIFRKQIRRYAST